MSNVHVRVYPTPCNFVGHATHARESIAYSLQFATYCTTFPFFLSAAQPTDQGEESVVVLLLLLVVVGGGPFSSLTCAVFWGVKRQKTLSKKGCEKAKTLSKKGCEKAKTSGPASLESFSLPCWSSWSKHEVRDLNNRTSEKKHLWKLHSKDCIF